VTINVIADGDWVVTVFPKLFEQIADWLGVQPHTGVLDLGSAGFRGFEAAVQEIQRSHRNHVQASKEARTMSSAD
jgi:hypothetical protein